jgi:DNA-binding CsgD family transcriptional regulator
MGQMMLAASPLTDRPAEPRPGDLIGRDRELELIGEFLDRAIGRGDALLVVGEPGVGKTALVDAAVDHAVASGFAVLRASGVEFEADIPFSGLHQLLSPLAGRIAQLGDAHRMALNVALGFGAGPAPNRLLVCTAVLTLIRAVATDQPVLVVVDDVHWLDRATAPVLGFLARRLAGTAAGFLASWRSDEHGYFERTGLTELEVPPLDSVTADRLLDSRYPLLSPRTRHRLLAQACGNPLALLELSRAASEYGSGVVAGLVEMPLGRRLRVMYAARLAEIPDRSRYVLLLMALDSTSDARALKAIRASPHGPADLGPAERARLIESEPGTYRLAFRHPLIRAAVVELASAGERRRAHRHLAQLTRDQPDRRAWHLGQASTDPDEQVAALLDQAAHSVLGRGDGVAAIAALIRAADLSPRAQDRARRLADAAFLGANVTGELRNAEVLLADAQRANAGRAGSVEAATAAAMVLLNGDGDVTTAHRLLLGALQTADLRTASPLTAYRALRTLELVCNYGGRAELWELFNRQKASLNQPEVQRLNPGVVADPVRNHGQALDRLDAEIAALADQADSTEIIRVAGAATFVDRLPHCRSALHRVVRNEADTGAVTSTIYADTLLAFEAYLTGQWDEAQHLANVTASLCESRGYRLLGWNARAVSAFLAAGRGDAEGSQTAADEMIRWAVPRGVRHVQADAWYACVLVALARSDFEAAYQNAVKLSPAGEFAPYQPRAPWVMLDLVDAALRTGRAAEAAAHVQAIRQTQVAKVSSRLALLAGAAQALVAPDSQAPALFEAALAIDGAELWSFDLARVHLLGGERLRRLREASRSRFHLTTALDIFRRLGAAPWADRAAMELRATGQTRPRREQRYEHEALTSQELQIGQLAATGLSNKEIGARLYLSHRTVGAHLYRIFPKLGIASRAALRDALEHYLCLRTG